MNVRAARVDSSPAIAGGRVVFTAPDSKAVICLNLKDGEELWQIPRGPKDLYMAGVFNGKVLIVGKESCKALDLLTGAQAWEQKTGMPSGQGVASNNVYYLPLKHGPSSEDPPEVCAINVDTGALHHTKARKKEVVPGNLVFYEGEVLSQGVWNISAFPQLKVKKAEMTARLQKNPKDPVGLSERGELNLDEGDLISAINDFKAALEFQPPPDVRVKSRAKLYDAITELCQDAVQKDFAKAEPYLSLYQDLCLNEVFGDEKIKRQSNYLCLLGKGRERQGREQGQELESRIPNRESRPDHSSTSFTSDAPRPCRNARVCTRSNFGSDASMARKNAFWLAQRRNRSMLKTG